MSKFFLRTRFRVINSAGTVHSRKKIAVKYFSQVYSDLIIIKVKCTANAFVDDLISIRLRWYHC